MWTCPKCCREFDNEPPHHFCDSGAATIEEYIDGQAEEVQPRLREVYAALKAALPKAMEKISYRMPAFWQGRNLLYFAAFKKWIGLFPGGRATTVFAGKLAGYTTTKGGIRLPYDKPLPLDLITEIAAWCGEHNAK
ncbi:MAG: DUF1801 domain-containing protein [Treponematales bacterium]